MIQRPVRFYPFSLLITAHMCLGANRLGVMWHIVWVRVRVRGCAAVRVC